MCSAEATSTTSVRLARVAIVVVEGGDGRRGGCWGIPQRRKRALAHTHTPRPEGVSGREQGGGRCDKRLPRMHRHLTK